MKIVNEPTNYPRLPEGWWIGRRDQCSRCGAVVELDSDDRPDLHISHDSESVHFPCACGYRLCIVQSRSAARSARIIEITMTEPEEKRPSLFRKLIG